MFSYRSQRLTKKITERTENVRQKDSDEFVELLLKNIGKLILMAQYRRSQDYKTVTQLTATMTPIVFQRPSETELQNYINKVETLRPLSEDDIEAVQTAKEDLYYLLRMKG